MQLCEAVSSLRSRGRQDDLNEINSHTSRITMPDLLGLVTK
jgi:hypothetical protein